MVIIFLLILVALAGGVQRLIIAASVKAIDKIQQKNKVERINNDFENLNNEWLQRVKQLKINLNEAVSVRYLKTDSNLQIISYCDLYFWPVEEAIAWFQSLNSFLSNGERERFQESPSTWVIHYIELKTVQSIYRRNDVCQIRFIDMTTIEFALEDFEKIKAVYNRAKEMSN